MTFCLCVRYERACLPRSAPLPCKHPLAPPLQVRSSSVSSFGSSLAGAVSGSGHVSDGSYSSAEIGPAPITIPDPAQAHHVVNSSGIEQRLQRALRLNGAASGRPPQGRGGGSRWNHQQVLQAPVSPAIQPRPPSHRDDAADRKRSDSIASSIAGSSTSVDFSQAISTAVTAAVSAALTAERGAAQSVAGASPKPPPVADSASAGQEDKTATPPPVSQGALPSPSSRGELSSLLKQLAVALQGEQRTIEAAAQPTPPVPSATSTHSESSAPTSAAPVVATPPAPAPAAPDTCTEQAQEALTLALSAAQQAAAKQAAAEAGARAAQERADTAEVQLDVARSDLARATQQVQRLEAMTATLQNQLAESQQRNEVLTRTVSGLEASLAEARQSDEKVRQEAASAAGEVSELRASVEQLRDENGRLQGSLARTRASEASLTQQLASAQAEAATSVSQRNAAQRSLDEARRTAQAHADIAADLRRQLEASRRGQAAVDASLSLLGSRAPAPVQAPLPPTTLAQAPVPAQVTRQDDPPPAYNSATASATLPSTSQAGAAATGGGAVAASHARTSHVPTQVHRATSDNARAAVLRQPFTLPSPPQAGGAVGHGPSHAFDGEGETASQAVGRIFGRMRSEIAPPPHGTRTHVYAATLPTPLPLPADSGRDPFSKALESATQAPFSTPYKAAPPDMDADTSDEEGGPPCVWELPSTSPAAPPTALAASPPPPATHQPPERTTTADAHTLASIGQGLAGLQAKLHLAAAALPADTATVIDSASSEATPAPACDDAASPPKKAKKRTRKRQAPQRSKSSARAVPSGSAARNPPWLAHLQSLQRRARKTGKGAAGRSRTRRQSAAAGAAQAKSTAPEETATLTPWGGLNDSGVSLPDVAGRP